MSVTIFDLQFLLNERNLVFTFFLSCIMLGKVVDCADLTISYCHFSLENIFSYTTCLFPFKSILQFLFLLFTEMILVLLLLMVPKMLSPWFPRLKIIFRVKECLHH